MEEEKINKVDFDDTDEYQIIDSEVENYITRAAKHENSQRLKTAADFIYVIRALNMILIALIAFALVYFNINNNKLANIIPGGMSTSTIIVLIIVITFILELFTYYLFECGIAFFKGLSDVVEHDYIESLISYNKLYNKEINHKR